MIGHDPDWPHPVLHLAVSLPSTTQNRLGAVESFASQPKIVKPLLLVPSQLKFPSILCGGLAWVVSGVGLPGVQV